MNGNFNASKFKDFFKNKNTVTAICAILIVIVLILGYNIRVKNATKPVYIPVARKTILPRTEITPQLVDVIEVPRAAISGKVYTNANDIYGKYTNINTMIPAGSMFYNEAVTTKSELPDATLYDVEEGETLFYLGVNMVTSYVNSILPGNYIDLYISTKENNRALVGKLIRDVRVLAVKTADGQNVFENTEKQGVPYLVIFALPEEQHLLLRSINAINNYSVYATTPGYSKIELFPVPTTTTADGLDVPPKSYISSNYLKDYILDMASVVPEEQKNDINNNINNDINININDNLTNE